MELTAYHGTLEKNIDSICAKGFIQSSKKTEWLGSGVYFFERKKHAEYWARAEAKKNHNCKHIPAIIYVQIKTEDDEYFDLDLKKNHETLQSFFNEFCANLGSGRPCFKDKDELRCFVCNLYKRSFPSIKVFAYTFVCIKDNSMGFSYVDYRKQYCVTHTPCIRIVKSEVI